MAEATYIINPNNIEITVASDATWVCTDYFPKGIVLHSMKIKGTPGDVAVFRENGTSTTLNATICHFGDSDGYGRKDTFTSAKIGGDKIYRHPVLCVSECTLVGSSFKVMIEYEL